MLTKRFAQHSPAPWKADAGGVVEAPDLFVVARVRMDAVTPEARAERRANLQLIKTSPELLAACEKAFRGKDEPMTPACRKALQIVIEKARSA